MAAQQPHGNGRVSRRTLALLPLLLTPALQLAAAAEPDPRAAFVAEAAARLPGLVRERTVEVDGQTFRVASAGDGPPALLLHGWPMTWREWRHVVPALAARHAVHAVDLPGLGGSGPPSAGYDTVAVAEDLRRLVRRLGLGRVALVGHDIGGMVALSYAARFPEEVTALAVVDVILPGVGGWDEASQSPKLWHFRFHQTPGLAETLTAGRERAYVGFFYDRDTVVKAAAEPAVLDAYAAAYALPEGGMAGFGYYRAFDRSAERNRALLAGRPLPMPALAVGGAASVGAQLARDLATVAPDLRTAVVEGCGHFVPEERPEVLASRLLELLTEAR